MQVRLRLLVNKYKKQVASDWSWKLPVLREYTSTGGIEPPTLRLGGVRSILLSYADLFEPLVILHSLSSICKRHFGSFVKKIFFITAKLRKIFVKQQTII